MSIQVVKTGFITSILLSFLVACTSTENNATSASIERPQAVPSHLKTTDWYCARLPISTQVSNEKLTLYVRDQSYELAAISAGSGAKYQNANGSTEFWNKGAEATLKIDGVELPICHQQGSLPARFSARGNEPFWQFSIENETLTLRTPNSESVSRFQLERNARIQHTLSAISSLGSLRAQIVKRVCLDSMTGLPYPYEVSGTLGERSIRGCGGRPEDLLQGAEWHINTVNGESTGSAIVTLTFLPNGRIAGSSGCNRYFGQYQMSGEGISISQLGMTRMACAPELAAMERRFTQQITRTRSLTIDSVGALVLSGSQGTIRAFAL